MDINDNLCHDLLMKSESGQALIIIVMVLVLSLATGLAVATRSSSTVHQTTNLAASEQSLATAESAVEEVLSATIGSDDTANAAALASKQFKSGANHSVSCASTDMASGVCYKDYGSNNATVSVSRSPIVGNNQPFVFKLDQDDVQQVWLAAGTNYLAPGIQVCWQAPSDPANAALEVTTIYGTSPSFSMSKLAFDPLLGRRSTDGFAAPAAGQTVPAGGVSYANCMTTGAITSGQAIRIRAYYSGTTVAVSPPIGMSIPYQANIITATGYSGDTKRTVQVTKTLPQLPGIFDYAIFSGGNLVNQ